MDVDIQRALQVEDGHAPAGGAHLLRDLLPELLHGDELLPVERVHQRVVQVAQLLELSHELDDVALVQTEGALRVLRARELRLEREDLVHRARGGRANPRSPPGASTEWRAMRRSDPSKK
eukprot:29099-Pelagococcus_subviridis.AAC.1